MNECYLPDQDPDCLLSAERGWLCALLVFCAVLAGCSPSGNGIQVPAGATILYFEEQDPGTDPYPVRMLVTAEYLRLDDGIDQGDFTLLERQSGTIFSVSHQERSVLVIEPRGPDREVPAEIELDAEQAIDEQAPLISGRQPVHVRYMANGELCYQAIVVPGLLSEVTAALIEYGELLAGRQVDNLSTTPLDLQTPCFLSRFVYAPVRHMKQGMPIQEWDDAGYRRMLMNFKTGEVVAASLFELPKDYDRLYLGM